MIDLAGIIPALVTPMDDDGTVNEAAISRYVDWVAAQGPVALAVNVDTGEGPHLDREERSRVLTLVHQAAAGRCSIVAGVGGPSTRDAVANARAAIDAGADALLVFPIPAFQSRPLHPAVAIEYHRAIADATNAPLILFQLQPELGGTLYEPDVLDSLLALEAVAAIKEASFDPIRFTQMRARVAASGRAVTLLTGNDNFIAESLLLGAEGALLGFATLGTREHVALLDAVRRRDMTSVAALGGRLQALADVIFAPPVGDYRARTKEALRLLGVIPSAAVRPPLLPIETQERQRVARALANAGLLP